MIRFSRLISCPRVFRHGCRLGLPVEEEHGGPWPREGEPPESAPFRCACFLPRRSLPALRIDRASRSPRHSIWRRAWTESRRWGREATRGTPSSLTFCSLDLFLALLVFCVSNRSRPRTQHAPTTTRRRRQPRSERRYTAHVVCLRAAAAPVSSARCVVLLLLSLLVLLGLPVTVDLATRTLGVAERRNSQHSVVADLFCWLA